MVNFLQDLDQPMHLAGIFVRTQMLLAIVTCATHSTLPKEERKAGMKPLRNV